MKPENPKLDLSSNVVILQLMAWMDGGSITLKCEDGNQVAFELEFVQRVSINDDFLRFPQVNIPGRIYLRNEMVKLRSKLEEQIIQCLKRIQFENPSTIGHEQTDIVKETIEYIESELYVIHYHETEEMIARHRPV